MGRIRRIDGHKLYNETWPASVRDVFVYLVTKAADNYGLFQRKVSVWAEDMKVCPRVVRRAVMRLSRDGCLLSYRCPQGVHYLIRNWQDYQALQYPGTPNCPLPPPAVLQKASKKTQELLQKASNKPSRAVAVADDVAVKDSPPSPPQGGPGEGVGGQVGGTGKRPNPIPERTKAITKPITPAESSGERRKQLEALRHNAALWDALSAERQQAVLDELAATAAKDNT